MNDKEFLDAMEHIVSALIERGYDPYAQLTGYVTENEPTYITSHKGARQLIVTLDMDRVKRFVKEMEQSVHSSDGCKSALSDLYAVEHKSQDCIFQSRLRSVRFCLRNSSFLYQVMGGVLWQN